jgi:hypothetical protein
MTAEANADFCSGGVEDTPEATIDAILAMHNQTDERFFYKAVTFYTNQCSTSYPWDFLQTYYTQLVSERWTKQSTTTIFVGYVHFL